MAHSLSNKCAKNLCKRTVLVQVIIKNVVTCFFGTQCTSILKKSKRPSYWNSTSGFDFDHLAVMCMLFCIKLPNFVQIGAHIVDI